ncbi:MAG: hypothetical protein JSV71_05415 [Nitrospiraceae bacterium]|nr:MAG: hypothetical protein JSV71_05415 [Nitrospiraceae bacterium]
MIINKVVLQFKDKTIKKGSTGDFLPNKKNFHLELPKGEIVEITMEDLKAVFFVKDHLGDSEYKEQYTENIPGGGRKIKVQFSDGEILIGYSQGYAPNRPGFFLTPADTKGNNERIFVLKSATESVEFT